MKLALTLNTSVTLIIVKKIKKRETQLGCDVDVVDLLLALALNADTKVQVCFFAPRFWSSPKLDSKVSRFTLLSVTTANVC